jgi:hypothetical protein
MAVELGERGQKSKIMPSFSSFFAIFLSKTKTCISETSAQNSKKTPNLLKIAPKNQ